MSTKPELKPEFATNRQQRCACLVLLDTSGSMAGEPIALVNAGLRTLLEGLRGNELASKRVDLGIMTFDSEVKLVRDFDNPDKYDAPTLTAQNETFMGTAIKDALAAIKSRMADYESNGVPCFKPWLFILTDGEPQGEPDAMIEEAKGLLSSAQNEKRGPLVFPVGVGDGANLERLDAITRPAQSVRLDPTKFKEMFQWIALSMSRVTNSKPGQQTATLPPPGWTQAQL